MGAGRRPRALRRPLHRPRAQRAAVPGAWAMHSRSRPATSSRSSRKLAFTGLGAVGVENTYLVGDGRARAAHGRDRGSGDRVIDAGLYRRLFAELAAIGRGPGGWNRMAWGPGEDAARDWFRAAAARARAGGRARTRPPTCGRSSRAGWRARSTRSARISTRSPTAARSTARSASWPGSWRSTRPAGPGRAAAAGRGRDGRRGGPALRRRDLRLARALRRARRRRDPRAHAIREGNVLRDLAARRGVTAATLRDGARVPAARGLLDRGARRAGPALVDVPAALGSRPRWPPGSAGAAPCAACRITPGRRRWRDAATHSCRRRARCWRRTSSPGRARSGGDGGSHQRPAGLDEPGAGRGAPEPRRARARTSAALERVREGVRAAARAGGVEAEWLLETRRPGLRRSMTGCAPRCTRRRARGPGRIDLAAYAGHDAGVLARHLPAAMLFVRNPTGSRTTRPRAHPRRTAWPPAPCSRGRSCARARASGRLGCPAPPARA